MGPYRTVAELGSGGMGRVLLGGSPDGRLVAIKQIRPEFARDGGFRARFRREVAASRKVSGAYTAAVVDADTEAPTPWLASVFVPGPSPRDVTKQAALDLEALRRLAAGLAAALVAIHGTGLIHRDLKPSNVLLAADGPRVIDFGIARATEVEGDDTRTGWLVGSPSFMSPEQAQLRSLTPATDVFSLGSVLASACTGASPFVGAATPQTLYRVVHHEPDLSMIPPELRGLIASCLAKDPAARPTPAQLLSAIGNVPASTRAWPDAVHRLIEAQQAEVDRALGAPRVPKPVTLRLSRRSLLFAGGALAGAGALTGTTAWALGGGGSKSPKAKIATAPAKPPVILTGHLGPLTRVAFSPDGHTLATASNDGTVRLWSVSSHQLIGRPLVVSTDSTSGKSVDGLAFSPDGRLLVTGGGDGAARLWDVAGRRKVGETSERAFPISDVAFSPDGRLLATAGGGSDLTDQSVALLWNSPGLDRNGAPIRSSNVLGFRRVVFSPNGGTLVTANWPTKTQIQFWAVNDRHQIGQPIAIGEYSVSDIAFSPDGRVVASCGQDNAVRLWDAATHQPIGQPLVGHTSSIEAVAFSPDGRTLASGGDDQTTRLWDVATRKQIGQPLIGPTKGVTSVVFSPDGRTLAAGSSDQAAWLWSMA
ncbi:WD40 repeat domain-containing serine/threonine protein kinase [Actinoallomurus sp. CA-150999]|uniref:WD40 repeat domain-containing serine/threonine protein kinase n=1 Tax=Actinoallomurus sp. CA-150999 TaxID=3239887 RepID=UPI003D911AB5